MPTKSKSILTLFGLALTLLMAPIAVHAQKAKKKGKTYTKSAPAMLPLPAPAQPKAPKIDPFDQAVAWLKKPDPTIDQQDSAFKIFEAAVEAGDPRSYKYMAQCYLEGKGVEPDKVKAEHWYMKGVSAGDADCLYYYGGKLYQSPMERCKGYHYLMRAAKKDNPDAMVKVAQIYTQGLQGNVRGRVEEKEEEGKSRQMKDTCLIVVDKAKVTYWYKRALHFYGKNGNPKDSMLVQDMLWKLEPMKLEQNDNVDLNR